MEAKLSLIQQGRTQSASGTCSASIGSTCPILGPLVSIRYLLAHAVLELQLQQELQVEERKDKLKVSYFTGPAYGILLLNTSS